MPAGTPKGLTAHQLITMGDDALVNAYGDLADLTGQGADDFPPSALIACLLAHAEHEGWDFDGAVAIAREFGASSATQIANAQRPSEESEGQ